MPCGLPASCRRASPRAPRRYFSWAALRRAVQLDPKLGEAEKISDVIKQLGG
jgi:hypothetical protein